MTEKEIIRLCRTKGTLRPLHQAIRFGAVKFKPLPRSNSHFFAMKSLGGLIVFEHDFYFYTKIDGIFLDRMVFLNDKPGFKGQFERTLSEINDGLRGI